MSVTEFESLLRRMIRVSLDNEGIEASLVLKQQDSEQFHVEACAYNTSNVMASSLQVRGMPEEPPDGWLSASEGPRVQLGGVWQQCLAGLQVRSLAACHQPHSCLTEGHDAIQGQELRLHHGAEDFA